ncbi:MAG: ribosomal protein S18-alanine N-acetyltransferase [Anaerolineaceae bacterium]|jgi:ribosomal-protein-alanine N-acetyltransferase
MTSKHNHSQLSLQRMTEADLMEVEALDKVSFSDPWPAGGFAYELKPGSENIVLVAKDISAPPGAQIVGYIVVWLVVDEAHIGTLAVAPTWQKLGIGRCLLAHALLQAKKSGAVKSHLEVRTSNAAALRLYYGFDYEVVGLRPGYYKDNKEDALLLTLPQLDVAKLKAACSLKV